MARRSRRRPPHRESKQRVLAVCESRETEPNYFRGLRDEQGVRVQFAVKLARGKGGTALDAVQRAISIKEQAKGDGREFEFDTVWCVLDVEQAGGNPQLAQARKLANENGIRAVLSNPAFEVWVLAHFERTAKSFIDCDKVIGHLQKHWRSAFGSEYEKNDRKIYHRLSGSTAEAVGNARWVREVHFRDRHDIVDCNSVTDVYRLVEFLLGAPE